LAKGEWQYRVKATFLLDSRGPLVSFSIGRSPFHASIGFRPLLHRPSAPSCCAASSNPTPSSCRCKTSWPRLPPPAQPSPPRWAFPRPLLARSPRRSPAGHRPSLARPGPAPTQSAARQPCPCCSVRKGQAHRTAHCTVTHRAMHRVHGGLYVSLGSFSWIHESGARSAKPIPISALSRPAEGPHTRDTDHCWENTTRPVTSQR